MTVAGEPQRLAALSVETVPERFGLNRSTILLPDAGT